jgi:hypothetical protein
MLISGPLGFGISMLTEAKANGSSDVAVGGDQPSKGTILKRGTFAGIWSHSGLGGEAQTRLVSGEATAGLLVRRSPRHGMKHVGKPIRS